MIILVNDSVFWLWRPKKRYSFPRSFEIHRICSPFQKPAQNIPYFILMCRVNAVSFTLFHFLFAG